MKINLIVLVLLSGAIGVPQSASKPVDLTGADAKQLRSHVGYIVTLRGRLEDETRKQPGLSLVGATANDAGFYVIPELPTNGVYSYPQTWTRWMHQKVRLTGKLSLRSFHQSEGPRAVQVPPDYFYMVLQSTTIAPVEAD
jgi:hypothetical protein